MSTRNIENTRWYKKLRESNGDSLVDEALSVERKTESVDIVYTNENGTWNYAIVPVNSDFWLDAYETLEEARSICNEMNWKINSEVNPYAI